MTSLSPTSYPSSMSGLSKMAGLKWWSGSVRSRRTLTRATQSIISLLSRLTHSRFPRSFLRLVKPQMSQIYQLQLQSQCYPSPQSHLSDRSPRPHPTPPRLTSLPSRGSIQVQDQSPPVAQYHPCIARMRPQLLPHLALLAHLALTRDVLHSPALAATIPLSPPPLPSHCTRAIVKWPLLVLWPPWVRARKPHHLARTFGTFLRSASFLFLFEIVSSPHLPSLAPQHPLSLR